MQARQYKGFFFYVIGHISVSSLSVISGVIDKAKIDTLGIFLTFPTINNRRPYFVFPSPLCVYVSLMGTCIFPEYNNPSNKKLPELNIREFGGQQLTFGLLNLGLADIKANTVTIS